VATTTMMLTPLKSRRQKDEMDQVAELRKNGKRAEAADLLRKMPPSFAASQEWAFLSFYLGDKEGASSTPR